MSRPFPSRSFPAGPFVRINGKIRAREVRVIGPEGNQLGILALHDAINLARSRTMDLVEVAPNAAPPVCRVVDYGKYRYEMAKKEKESRKHQHASRVKEIQLSASIDPHDFGVKLEHAVDFLCEEMKVKVSLRFRGREMAHQGIGTQVVERFIKDIAPYGYAVETPRLTGRNLNVMLTPLPRNKRAKNPRQSATAGEAAHAPKKEATPLRQVSLEVKPDGAVADRAEAAEDGLAGGFVNNPFAQLDGKVRDRPAA